MPHNVNNWTKTTDPFMVAILFVLFEVVVLCPDFNTSSFSNIVYDVITGIENDKYDFMHDVQLRKTKQHKGKII